MIRVILIAIIFSGLAFSQGKKYEFAKSYLENGQLEDAARLFGELYEEFPNDDAVVEGLLGSYYGLNRFTEMEQPLEKYAKSSNDPSLYALLGEVYWKMAKEDLAKETWENTLEKYDKRVDAYNFVAAAQTKNRLFQDAINTYQQARSNLSDKLIFDEEIIKLYISIGDYENGTKEIIKSLEKEKAIPTAQGRLYALMANEEATKFIGRYLKKEADDNSTSFVLQELLAWYYNTTNNFDDAFEVYKRLDELKNSKGGTILKFAENARKDENYKPAITAYEHIIDNKSEYKKYFRNALLGYARTLESGLVKADSISEERIEQIVERYEDIINDDPKSNLAEESYYRIAQINRNQLKDYDEAKKYFGQVIDLFKTTPKAAMASIEIGDINLLERNIEGAISSYQFVVDKFPKALARQKNLASYKLAMAKYYQGKSAETVEYLQPLTEVQNQDMANNSLEMIYFIEENKEFEGAADSLGKAEYFAMISQNADDTLKAEFSYRDIHKNFPATPAAEKAFKKMAIMYEDGNPEKSIDIIDQFMFLYPTSIIVDEMLIIKAQGYEKLGDVAEAQKVYSKILIEYPNSIYLQEARDSIRRLRGEL